MKSTLLTINDIYDSNPYRPKFTAKTPSNGKLIAHFSVLYILDIFEGLIDASNNNYFKKENI